MQCIRDLPGDAAEQAVVAALRWLKANQEKDGSWKCGQSAPAGTALATLAFLRHGETPDSPEFGQAVSAGLLYLAQHIDTNGLVSGVSQDYIGYGYSQGPVVLALAEGYAIAQSPILRAPLDRALQAVFREQIAPKDRPQDIGGWRDQSQTRDSDVTVTGWMVLALKSAQAAGIEIPQAVFDKAGQYLWNMYDTKNPGFGYQNPERYPTTTAIGVFSQQFLGNAGDPRVKASLDYLHEQKVDWEKSAGDFVLYGWYCMTQAMFRGGSPYREYWSDQIQDTLVKNQQSDGHWLPPPHSNSEVRDLAGHPRVLDRARRTDSRSLLASASAWARRLRLPRARLALGLVLAQRLFLGRNIGSFRYIVAVLGDEAVPLRRQVAFSENRLHRAHGYARGAVNTFVRMDVQPIVNLVKTIDGTNLYAIGEFATDTGFSHNMGHNRSLLFLFEILGVKLSASV